MAVEYGNVSEMAQSPTSWTSANWNHTVINKPHRVTLVLVGLAIGDDVTSVTLGGLACTKLDSHEGNSCRVEVWYRESPPAGVQEIIVNKASGGGHAGACDVHRVDLAAWYSARVKKTATTQLIDIDIPTVGADDLVIDALSMTGAGGYNPTVDPSQTEIYKGWDTQPSLPARRWGAASRETGSGTVNMRWTQGAFNGWAILGFRVLPGDLAGMKQCIPIL